MSGLLQEMCGMVCLLCFDNLVWCNVLLLVLCMELLWVLEVVECDLLICSVLLIGGEEVFCVGGDLGDMWVIELVVGRV